MELGKWNDAAFRPRVVLSNNQREFIGAKAFIAQVWRMTGDEPETSVHSPFLQGGLNFGRGNFLDDQADGGMRGREHAKQIRNQRNVQDGDDAEVQHAA